MKRLKFPHERAGVTRVFAMIALAICLLTGSPTARASEQLIQAEERARTLSAEWTLESVKESITLWRETGEGWLNSGDFDRADECFAEAALAAQMLGQYELAEEMLAKSVGRSGAPRSTNAMPLAVLSLLKLEKGDSAQADKFSRAAIAYDSRPRSRALAYFARGSYEYYYGRSSESLRLFELARAAAIQTDDKLLQTNTAIYFAYALLREGRPFEAEQTIAALADLCAAPSERKCRTQAEIGKGFVYYFMSDLQKALDTFRNAESMLPRDFEYMDRARVLTATGIVYSDLGENQTAVALFEEAIRVYEPTGYKAGQTTTLTFLAENLALSGDDNGARERYSQALDLARSIDDKFRVGNVFEGLGLLDHRAGRFRDAIGRYRVAINTYRSVGVRIPMAEMLLANAHRDIGEYDRAETIYRSAIARNREIRDNRQLAECLYEFALLLEKRGRPGEAVSVAAESVDVTEKLYSQVAATGLRRSFVSSVFSRYEVLLRLGLRRSGGIPNPDATRSALVLSERARARSMLESIRRARADSGDVGDVWHRERELLALLGSRADRLTQVLSINPASAEAEELKSEVLRLERDLDNLRSETGRGGIQDRKLSEFDPESFRRGFLDDRTVLLEFFVGETESYVWVVTREKIDLFKSAAAKRIARGAGDLRSLITKRNTTTFASVDEFLEHRQQIESEIDRALGSLGTDLLGEVPGYFEGKRLLIVGDAVIEGIPLGALRQRNDPQNRPLLESNEIIFVPSARFLTENPLPTRHDSSRPGLVVWDAVYASGDERIKRPQPASSAADSESSNRRFSDWYNLSRLTGSIKEGEYVADSIGAATADRLTGFGANRKEIISRDLRKHGLLHFAAHGVVFSTEHSLSGLVLSRFDSGGATIDSMLRLQDIYSLRLSADLVVLSACETGVGPEMRGEGLLSLNNAFLQSGARSVVSTLWKVDDQATLELMTEFYRLMAEEKRVPAEALRLAQLKLRENPRYSSPYYWAAFTFHGDYSAAPSFPEKSAVSFRMLIAATAIFAAIALIAFLITRRKGRRQYPVRA